MCNVIRTKLFHKFSHNNTIMILLHYNLRNPIINYNNVRCLLEQVLATPRLIIEGCLFDEDLYLSNYDVCLLFESIEFFLWIV